MTYIQHEAKVLFRHHTDRSSSLFYFVQQKRRRSLSCMWCEAKCDFNLVSCELMCKGAERTFMKPIPPMIWMHSSVTVHAAS